MIADMSQGQYKMKILTWSSPKSSSSTTSLGSHAITWPLTMKIPSTSTTSHSVPDAPPCSLIDSTTSLRWKQRKDKKLGYVP
jgi:hypothetical protein